MECNTMDAGRAIGETLASELSRLHLSGTATAAAVAPVLESASWTAAAISLRRTQSGPAQVEPVSEALTVRLRKQGLMDDLEALLATPPKALTAESICIWDPADLELGLNAALLKALADSTQPCDRELLSALNDQRAAYFQPMSLASHAKLGPLFWLRDYALSFSERNGDSKGDETAEWLSSRLAAVGQAVKATIAAIPDSVGALTAAHDAGLSGGLLPEEVSRPCLARDALNDLTMFETIMADAMFMSGLDSAPSEAPQPSSP